MKTILIIGKNDKTLTDEQLQKAHLVIDVSSPGQPLIVKNYLGTNNHVCKEKKRLSQLLFDYVEDEIRHG